MQEEDEKVGELEHRADVEHGKLEVAEEFGWLVGILAAVIVYLKFGSWWLAALAVIGAYFLTTYPYRRRDRAAEDTYHRAAGLGKYYVSPNDGKGE